MASGSPHHRSTQSVSTTNLRLPGAAQGSSPTPVQQRRMTSPVGSLTLPDGGRRPSPRPPSPLRNGFVMDTGTGIDPNTSYDGSDGDHDDDDDDDDPAKWHRSPSPASSVSHLAASFVQRMNSFVGGIAPKSPVGMPTDAELEAEAERERDRSRREAEAILTREAQQRKLVEERVLAMMESAKSLPPPPSRSQTMSSNPPSPSNSQKETNWWTAAKNKLTPTKDKEPLTPAQQVIQDAKAREKKGGKGKDKEKEKEWPSNSQGKYNDPAFANLNIPVAPPTRKPVPSSPSSPTPSRPSLSNMPPNLTPSPMRTTDTISSSPSREAPPMYAQFNAQGTLDVPGTLLAIAKRFEKLEKWTVGHVRALEDRMNDVEKWLVDKENEKNTATAPTTPLQAEQTNSDAPDVRNELHEIREEMSELQGRVGELGREMAKMATAPSNLSSGPRIQTATISPAPQSTTTSSFTIKQDHTGSSIPSTPRHPRLSSSTALETTSPPIASKNKTPSGTRLPYPQGDYTSPPDAFSPTNSPPGSINASMRSQSISISGLPNTASSTTMYSSSGSYSSISSFGGRTMSPSPMSPSRSTASVAAAARAISPTPVSTGLPPPSKPATQRQTSVSPTPRKRYTVALGGPLTAPDELSSSSDAKDSKRGRGSGGYKSKSTFGDDQDDDDDDDGSEFGAGEETIGKSAAARLVNSGSLVGRAGGSGDYKQQHPAPPAPVPAPPPFESSSASPSSSSNNNNTNGNSSSRRVRAQSAYGFSSIAAGSNSISATILSNIHTTTTPTSSSSSSSGTTLPSVAPLKPRIRSKSSERLNSHSHSGTGGDGMMFGGTTTKFVDPLVLRRQSKDSLMVGKPNIAMPKPVVGRKVPIGQLVAFFDGDKK
ncbi:hypothetical protein M413DRAFT_445320 [Hebeloma cylindrosporum]|uniref:Uncharacterized protein n=1 Tax=Hebeloma cylindrosporum TaxID=76867 RepID=A0A0C2XUF5_HEBCY|nr:hypothetical protein M413DRAFT_445320 [Hebeloma cylindrosporum h7]